MLIEFSRLNYFILSHAGSAEDFFRLSSHKTHTKCFLSFRSLWAHCEGRRRDAPICYSPMFFFWFFFPLSATFHVLSVRAQAVINAGSTDHERCPLTSNCGHLTALLASRTINFHSASWCLILGVRFTKKVRTWKHGQKLNRSRWLMTKLIYSGSQCAAQVS